MLNSDLGIWDDDKWISRVLPQLFNKNQIFKREQTLLIFVPIWLEMALCQISLHSVGMKWL